MYGIYGNIYHQYTPSVSINIPAPWILWVVVIQWSLFQGCSQETRHRSWDAAASHSLSGLEPPIWESGDTTQQKCGFLRMHIPSHDLSKSYTLW